jgi:sulfur-oxidizing protein SoxY
MSSADRRRIGMVRAAGLSFACLALVLAAPAAMAETPNPSAAAAAAADEDSIWSALRGDLFGDRELVEGSSAIALDAPARATDPAIVPITLALDPAHDIRKVTLVIDENPAPVAATFDIAEGAGVTQLSTRVRVNAYTDIHAVAESADGTLYVTSRFVKAAGGCAAPAAKDAEVAAREMGQMKLRVFEAPADAGRHEAQLMIRHPNNSGLQKDQVTLLYIPAHFISDVEITRNGERLFSMTGGISLSEDPSFRFDYAGDAASSFHARATDTDGNVFEKSFAGEQS